MFKDIVMPGRPPACDTASVLFVATTESSRPPACQRTASRRTPSGVLGLVECSCLRLRILHCWRIALPYVVEVYQFVAHGNFFFQIDTLLFPSVKFV